MNKRILAIGMISILLFTSVLSFPAYANEKNTENKKPLLIKESDQYKINIYGGLFTHVVITSKNGEKFNASVIIRVTKFTKELPEEVGTKWYDFREVTPLKPYVVINGLQLISCGIMGEIFIWIYAEDYHNKIADIKGSYFLGIAYTYRDYTPE